MKQTKEEIRQMMKENGYEEISQDEYIYLDGEGECYFLIEDIKLFFKPNSEEEKEVLLEQIQDIIIEWEWNNIEADKVLNKIYDIIKEFKGE